MGQRQQYIIDRKFQLKHTFTIIGTVTVVTALILGLITASVVINNERIRNIYEIEASIMNFFSMQAESSADQTYLMAYKTQRKNHDRNMDKLKEIITMNRYLLILVLGIVIIQAVALYAMLIRRTHRISGPVWVMSQYIRAIQEGDKPVIRALRQKDEIQDFYNLMTELLVEKDLASKKEPGGE